MLLQRIKPCRYTSESILTLFFCLFSNNLYACLSRIIDFSLSRRFSLVRVLHISVRYVSLTLKTLFIDRLKSGLLSHLYAGRC
jgi:hypothetical protein